MFTGRAVIEGVEEQLAEDGVEEQLAEGGVESRYEKKTK